MPSSGVPTEHCIHNKQIFQKMQKSPCWAVSWLLSAFHSYVILPSRLFICSWLPVLVLLSSYPNPSSTAGSFLLEGSIHRVLSLLWTLPDVSGYTLPYVSNKNHLLSHDLHILVFCQKTKFFQCALP